MVSLFSSCSLTSAADVLVRSLRISGFPLDGIGLTGTGTTMEGCWVGLDATGSADPNLRGIGIAGKGHIIGDGEQRNIISGNLDGGILIGSTASEVTIEANRIGTDEDGLVAIGNGNLGTGIRIDGDIDTVEGNVISGNDSVGVWMTGDMNTVKGNVVGLSDSNLEMGNGFAGVFVSEGADDNLIVGTTLFESSIISGNLENAFGQGGSGVFTRVANPHVG